MKKEVEVEYLGKTWKLRGEYLNEEFLAGEIFLQDAPPQGESRWIDLTFMADELLWDEGFVMDLEKAGALRLTEIEKEKNNV